MSEISQETMYEYVLRKLTENKGRLQGIATELKLSKFTLYAIEAKRIASPNIHTVQKLHDYFKKSAD